ncbi:PBP1A family penicillin-binding protein [Leisingera aquaemixtae]|uniref:peptidoglycan glycosyltransferase n=1 Tax=Leisingera aquaemixtae TaxID=1396826 RepID=A0ABY5WPN6_9RHOB|nr:PBP1A family penicillin-binding protein [Leisingera aquaemixtae]
MRDRLRATATTPRVSDQRNDKEPVAETAAVGTAARLIKSLFAAFGRLTWKQRAAAAATVAAVAGIAVAAIALASLEDLADLEAKAEPAVRFEDAAGEPLMMQGEKPSNYAALGQVPEDLTNAVIAIEDQRFYEHGGLDYRAISRALWANAAAGEIVQGGSTITQQLVKISYLEPDRTYRRKLHEALLTRQLEARYSKDQILEMYLNRVYMGHGARGVSAAAQIYFGKPLEKLTTAESAALAAVIRAPSAVNPFTDLAALKQRAELVLRQMQGMELLDGPGFNQAMADLTVMAPQPAGIVYGGWFSDLVASRSADLAQRFDGASSVRTTLEPELQRLAERVVSEALAGHDMQAALVALRPDGRVAALVGGRDYQDSQFNRATQARRQPGSTFKTFVYLAALAEGYRLGDVIEDRPVEIDGYEPQNFDGRFHGKVTLQEAFSQSLNAAAVNLAGRVGIGKVAETARLLGIEAELTETPSLALGASEVTLLDLTEAFAAIATGTVPFKARFVQGITAGEPAQYYPFKWQAPAPSGEAARLMQHRGDMVALLRNAVLSGTGQAAAAVPGAAGKTGTSQNHRDALFVGFTEDLIVGVWVGNDDNSPMEGVTGGQLPARIWAAFAAGSGAGSVVPDAADALPVAAADGSDDASETAAGVSASADAAASRSSSGARFPPGTGHVVVRDAEQARAAIQRMVQSGKPIRAAELRDLLIGTVNGATASCNVRACQRAYRSFRASDCSYQPYGGGRRRLCTR